MCDVMILEDDPLVRLVIADTLTEEGLNVCEVGSVPDAREALTLPPPCRVLVADHDLGGSDEGNGFAFAAQALSTLPELRVIYVTGRPHLLNDRALTARERALPKPFLPTELLELTRELLGTAR